MKNGFEYEAQTLLLATWNFAYFRYILKEIKPAELNEIIKKSNTIFNTLKGAKFQHADFLNDKELRDKTTKIYNLLTPAVKQTGATKMMSLKMPELFIMWDTGIRKKWKIRNSAKADDYLNFLVLMQNEFKKINFATSKSPPAKAVDEYNYITSEQNKKKKQKQ